MASRKPSIDSVVTFIHEGTQVVARVEGTRWIFALKCCCYTWTLASGGTIETMGLPRGITVVCDPAQASK